MPESFAKRFILPVLLTVTLAAMAFALRGKGRLPDTPEDAVRALFAAAGQGDASAYLALLSGPLHDSLREAQSQLGAAAFHDSLGNLVTGMKGLAVSRAGETSEDRAALEVELIFADHSERQRFDLVRESRGWLIATIGQAIVEKPQEPYGKPVYDFAPASDPNSEPRGVTGDKTGT